MIAVLALMLAAPAHAISDAELWQQVLDASKRCGKPCMFNEPDSPKTDQDWAAKLAGVSPEAAAKLRATRWLSMPQSAVDSYTGSSGGAPPLPPATDPQKGPPGTNTTTNPSSPGGGVTPPGPPFGGGQTPGAGQTPGGGPVPGGGPSDASSDGAGPGGGGAGGAGEPDAVGAPVQAARGTGHLAGAQSVADKFGKNGGGMFGPEKRDELPDPKSRRDGSGRAGPNGPGGPPGSGGLANSGGPARAASSGSAAPGFSAATPSSRVSRAPSFADGGAVMQQTAQSGAPPRGAASGPSAALGGGSRLPDAAASASKAGAAEKPSVKPSGARQLPEEDEKDLDALEKLLDQASKDGKFDRRAAVMQLRRRPEAGGPMREQIKAALNLTGRRLTNAERNQLLQFAAELGLQLDPEQQARLVKGFEMAEPPAPEDQKKLTWLEQLRVYVRRLLAGWLN